MISIKAHRRRRRRSIQAIWQTGRLAIECLEQRVVLANDIGFAEPVAYAVGNNPEGLTTADLNADGYLDLVECNRRSGAVGQIAMARLGV